MQVLSLFMAAVVFAMWAFSVFRALLGMRARAVERSQKPMPGMGDTLREAGFWLRDPAFGKERRQLVIMTLCVIGLATLIGLTGAPQE